MSFPGGEGRRRGSLLLHPHPVLSDATSSLPARPGRVDVTIKAILSEKVAEIQCRMEEEMFMFTPELIQIMSILSYIIVVTIFPCTYLMLHVPA